jgi:hypothetical protein
MAVVVVGLAACDRGSASSAHASTATTTTSKRTRTAAITTPITMAAGVAHCRTASLTVVLADSGAAAGTFFSEIAFRNDSQSPCELTGYPGVSFLDGAGAQIGAPAERTGAAYHQVDIAPRADAYALLAVPDPDVRACPTESAQFVRVYPPNETRPLLIRAQSIRVCSQQIPPASIAPVVSSPVN